MHNTLSEQSDLVVADKLTAIGNITNVDWAESWTNIFKMLEEGRCCQSPAVMELFQYWKNEVFPNTDLDGSSINHAGAEEVDAAFRLMLAAPVILLYFAGNIY